MFIPSFSDDNMDLTEGIARLYDIPSTLSGISFRNTDLNSSTTELSGGTQFDLIETTALVREKTSHLKGLKIAIMGCIVNGPGEMADADYGYVGTGVGKVSLYKKQDVIKKDVPTELASQALIDLIKENDGWSIHGLWPQYSNNKYQTFCKQVEFSNEYQYNQII